MKIKKEQSKNYANYKSAKIFLPGFGFGKEPQRIYGNRIVFTRKDYRIEAVHPHYYIPDFLCSNPRVREKIVKPTVRLVCRDMKSAEDSFEKLREFAKCGIVRKQLYYERDGKCFRFYDCRDPGNPFGRTNFEGAYEDYIDLFQKLEKFKDMDHPLREIANSIGKGFEEHRACKTYYSEAKTLEDAIENIITIYKSKNEIYNVTRLLSYHL